VKRGRGLPTSLYAHVLLLPRTEGDADDYSSKEIDMLNFKIVSTGWVKKILVVDDNKFAYLGVESYLTRRVCKNLEILFAGNSKEFFEIIKEHKDINVFLMDYSLGERLTGRDLTNYIINNYENKEAIVIANSVESSNNEELEKIGAISLHAPLKIRTEIYDWILENKHNHPYTAGGKECPNCPGCLEMSRNDF